MKISVFGLGYVGLTTAACIASKGFRVVGVDIDTGRLAHIRTSEPPFHERGLNSILKRVLRKGLLDVTNDFGEAITETSLSFVAVGTPSLNDGSADVSPVESVANQIGSSLRQKDGYHLVVVRSTVPPGTTRKFGRELAISSGKSIGDEIGLAANPEFLREGSAVQDTLNPHKIVIGAIDKRSENELVNFYKRLYSQKVPIIQTNPETAELIKYANNAFLANKVSMINEIANICSKVPNADVNLVAKAIGLDPRIGPEFLRAGSGFGGSCLPKDLRAFINFSRKMSYEPNLLEAIEKVNANQPYQAITLAKTLMGAVRGKKIAILGLAFKKDTDDVREAVSLRIVDALLRESANVVVHDPVAVESAKIVLGEKVEYADSVQGCLRGADCCIVVTEWDDYAKLKAEDFIRNMKEPVVVDGRRIYDPKKFIGKVKFAAVGLGPRTERPS